MPYGLPTGGDPLPTQAVPLIEGNKTVLYASLLVEVASTVAAKEISKNGRQTVNFKRSPDAQAQKDVRVIRATKEAMCHQEQKRTSMTNRFEQRTRFDMRRHCRARPIPLVSIRTKTQLQQCLQHYLDCKQHVAESEVVLFRNEAPPTQDM